MAAEESELVQLCVADNPVGESYRYPNSDK